MAVIICCIITFTFVFENYSQNQSTISPSIKELHDKGNKYYIFGYGSLINEESRKQTGITGKAIPVRIHHMTRGWNYDVDTIHHPKLSNTPYTAVGVTIDKNNFDSTVNGVIFDIEYDEISKYDEREARYQRYQIDPMDIEILETNNGNDAFLDQNAIVYVYIVPDDIVLSLDDIDTRILKQSYIDKFISGCFDVNGYEFALECIESTKGWNGKYQNDRDESTFSKEKISKEVLSKIDNILVAQHLPFLQQSDQ